MSKDIAHLLEEWEYDPEETIRFIEGDRGRQLLQVRRHLGIEQYELEGRPDGARPFDRESVLDEIESRLSKFVEANGEDGGYSIDHEDFALLQDEGILYYLRYLALFQIGDYERTSKDTQHNLRLCNIVERYCTNKEDRMSLLQYKPYILRVNALSRSMLHLGKNEKKEALSVLRAAIEEIESASPVSTSVFRYEREKSIEQLKGTLEQLATYKVGPLEQLEAEFDDAVEFEDYERAVILRDKIHRLKDSG
jgi:hypothetical protein